jgi:hypothetical protein
LPQVGNKYVLQRVKTRLFLTDPFFSFLPIVVGSVFVCSVDCMAWFRSLSSLHSKTSVNTVHRLFIIGRWLKQNIFIALLD